MMSFVARAQSQRYERRLTLGDLAGDGRLGVTGVILGDVGGGLVGRVGNGDGRRVGHCDKSLCVCGCGCEWVE